MAGRAEIAVHLGADHRLGAGELSAIEGCRTRRGTIQTPAVGEMTGGAGNLGDLAELIYKGTWARCSIPDVLEVGLGVAGDGRNLGAALLAMTSQAETFGFVGALGIDLGRPEMPPTHAFEGVNLVTRGTRSRLGDVPGELIRAVAGHLDMIGLGMTLGADLHRQGTGPCCWLPPRGKASWRSRHHAAPRPFCLGWRGTACKDRPRTRNVKAFSTSFLRGGRHGRMNMRPSRRSRVEAGC